MIDESGLSPQLLDIIFQNRNKAYGAYALRANYNQRLRLALIISLSLTLPLALIPVKNGNAKAETGLTKPVVVITGVGLPKTARSVQPTRSRQPKPTTSTPFQVVPDDRIVKPTTTESNDLPVQGLDADVKGESAVDLQGTSGPPANRDSSGASRPETGTKLSSSEAQFPGGKEAFAKFLAKHLIVPADIEAGDTKLVIVRFMVDKDGVISEAAVIQSDGEQYSREVLRVLAQMPKWIPAVQNGVKAASWFVQPVSFVGVED